MRKNGDISGVASYATETHDDLRSALRDSIFKFAAAMMAVNLLAKSVASTQIEFGRGPDLITRKVDPRGRAKHLRERFPRLESELCIQTQGAIVIGGLHESASGKIVLLRSTHDRAHQLPSDGLVLHRRIN